MSVLWDSGKPLHSSHLQRLTSQWNNWKSIRLTHCLSLPGSVPPSPLMSPSPQDLIFHKAGAGRTTPPMARWSPGHRHQARPCRRHWLGTLRPSFQGKRSERPLPGATSRGPSLSTAASPRVISGFLTGAPHELQKHVEAAGRAWDLTGGGETGRKAGTRWACVLRWC